MKTIIRSVTVALVSAMIAMTSHAQMGLGTWNLAWLMDQQTHTKWVDACKSIDWRTEDELKTAGKSLPVSLAGMPYCDVHDGIDFRRKAQCKQTLGTALNARPSTADSPDGKCRISPDLADWIQYELKLRALRETFLNMERDGVTMVGLQEVFGEDAVRQVLPSGWEVKTSANLSNSPKIPQHVGLAWKTSVHPNVRDFTLLTELSSVGTRPLRPGLQFTFDLDGKTVEGLVVHMKAGCRSVALNNPKRDSEKEACPLLAQQVDVVEQWIDSRVGREFVILGDFNRTLLNELEQYPQPDATRFGKTPKGQAAVVAPEWNDNVPPGSLIYVVPHLRKDDGSLVAGDYFCAQTTGIDHVILSDALLNRIGAKANGLQLLPVSYRMDGKKLPVTKSTVPPSDHCARYVRVPG